MNAPYKTAPMLCTRAGCLVVLDMGTDKKIALYGSVAFTAHSRKIGSVLWVLRRGSCFTEPNRLHVGIERRMAWQE
jgi:hypothetical protein